MTPAAAETLALEALGFIAASDDLLPAFLNATGAAPSEIAALATEPAFLVAILDFLLSDDALVLAFAARAGVSPTAPLAARRALPGGAEVHWT